MTINIYFEAYIYILGDWVVLGERGGGGEGATGEDRGACSRLGLVRLLKVLR